MDLTPLIASFTLFSLMEFGDKTHIAVITLSMKNRPLTVFIGALGAFAFIDGLSVLIGGFIADLIPTTMVNIISGSLFLLFGFLTLREKNDDDDVNVNQKGALTSAFSLVTLMELGDKTQFASFVLAARYGSPGLVFLGILLGAALITGSGVVIGRGLMRLIPRRYLRYFAAILFIVFGIVFLVSAFLGFEFL
jgi:putative Ca2+/H+ antiporter (TMEM165/GDT1 family)